MKIIIMGCDQVGEQVSLFMDREGHTVTVIDEDIKTLEHIDPSFKGTKVRGVGFDRKVLIQAGIETADAFVATSPSDNANIVAARIARNIFHVPRVIARLYDPRRAEIYRRLGLVTISMTAWGVERVNELLTHTNLDPVMTFGRGEVSLVTTELPPRLVGRTVSQVTVPGEIMVVAITRQGEALVPISGTEFSRGDTVHFAVQAHAMERLEALLEL
jgi:trk system potassium uptake protein TrkA